MAALAAIALLICMFLPWYEKSTVPPRGGARFVTSTVSAFGVFSFVEAAVLLVSGGILLMLFARAEQRPFHLPGGDGSVIFAAGLWASVLLFYRVFDRPNVTGNAGTVGIQWGFFVAFVAAGALAFAGARVRASHRPEPEIPPPPPRQRRRRAPRAGAPPHSASDDTPAPTPASPGDDPHAAPTRHLAVDPGEQLTIDDAAPGEHPHDER